MIPLKVTEVKNAWFATISFLIMDSKFNNPDCNGFHGLIILFPNISDIATITVKNVDYRCIISKSDTINLLKNSILENRGYI